jgi:hypothetical protein
MFSRRSIFRLLASAVVFLYAPRHGRAATSFEDDATEADIFVGATADIDLDQSLTGIVSAAVARMKAIGRKPPSVMKAIADGEIVDSDAADDGVWWWDNNGRMEDGVM